MLEHALVAFTTLLATVGPIDVAALFAGLTARATPRRRHRMAFKGVAIAAAVLLFFTLFGSAVLAGLGVTLPALRVAGGILLLLIGIDLVFARQSGGVTTTEEEETEAEHRRDISVFPLATPLIAGPGAIGAVILLTGKTDDRLLAIGIVVAAVALVMAITLACLLLAAQLARLFGVTGLAVVNRIFGFLLCAIAVQFIFDGVKSSGLLT
jgi:multiple antibiotic resistance protein